MGQIVHAVSAIGTLMLIIFAVTVAGVLLETNRNKHDTRERDFAIGLLTTSILAGVFMFGSLWGWFK